MSLIIAPLGGAWSLPCLFPGVSAPIFLPAVFSQGMDEALGGWVTVKLIDERVSPYCCLRCTRRI